VRHIKYNTTIRLGRSVLQLMVSHYSPTTARIDIAIIIQMIINMNFVTGNENQSQRSEVKGLMIHTHNPSTYIIIKCVYKLEYICTLYSIGRIGIICFHCATVDETLQNIYNIIIIRSPATFGAVRTVFV